jgi:hypothetical protein
MNSVVLGFPNPLLAVRLMLTAGSTIAIVRRGRSTPVPCTPTRP